MLARLKNNIVIRNTFFLITIQFFNYVFPLLTIPYLIHVFELELFGVISLAQLIAGYLYIITDYGFNLSGTRLVSLHRQEYAKLNEIFTHIISSKLMLSLGAVLLGTIVVLATPQFSNYFYFYFVMILSVAGQVFFPTWFFQGIENMKVISIINGISRAVSTLFIFILVNEKTDLMLYAYIYTLTNIVVGLCAFAWCYKKYHIQWTPVKFSIVKEYLYSGFNVFLPTFFSTFFTTGGILILGLIHGEKLVGIFNAIDKFVKAFLSLVGSFTQALFPNISNLFSVDPQKAFESLKKNARIVLAGLFFCFMCSLMLSDLFLQIVYDTSFVKYSYILHILMIWLVVSFANNFIGIQFLVGSGNSYYYRKSFLYSIVITTVLFLLIIPFQIDGLLAALVLGELALLLILVIVIYKNQLITKLSNERKN